MSERRWMVLTALAVSAILLHPAAGYGQPVTYEGFLERARALKVGATRADIVKALGSPQEDGTTFLHYALTSLPGFPGLPPPPGTQVFAEARIELAAGRMVGAIRWAWMDATGPPPPGNRP